MNITPELIIIIISIVLYGIVFFIQKAHFNKQNDILNKYEKIFSIIDIDEIEKYIELQKKSINLSIQNREIELKNDEIKLKTDIKEVREILNGAKSNQQKSEEITNNLDNLFTKNNKLISEIKNLSLSEFKEIESKSIEIIEKSQKPELLEEYKIEIEKIMKKYSEKFKQLI